MNQTTLTVREIYDLAFMAGILEDRIKPDEDDGEMEITIGPCPEIGVHHQVPDIVSHYRAIAWYEDYPDEGVFGLGPELPAKQKGGGDVQ